MLTINTSTNIVPTSSSSPSKTQNTPAALENNGYRCEKKFVESLSYESTLVFRTCQSRSGHEESCYFSDKENNTHGNNENCKERSFPKLTLATPINDVEDRDCRSISNSRSSESNNVRDKVWKHTPTQEIFWSNVLSIGDGGDYCIM